MTTQGSSEIQAVRALLATSKCPLFITGAGVSVGAGLPTYRGTAGLYDNRETEDGMPIEEALSGAMFLNRPEVTWKYLWEIADVCNGAQPSVSHRAIARILADRPDGWVLTQNVDGLHHATGVRNLIEIHGRAEQVECASCPFSSEAPKIPTNLSQSATSGS